MFIKLIQYSLVALFLGVVVLAVLMILIGYVFGLDCVKNNIPTPNAWMLVAHSVVMISIFGAISF